MGFFSKKNIRISKKEKAHRSTIKNIKSAKCLYCRKEFRKRKKLTGSQ